MQLKASLQHRIFTQSYLKMTPHYLVETCHRNDSCFVQASAVNGLFKFLKASWQARDCMCRGGSVRRGKIGDFCHDHPHGESSREGTGPWISRRQIDRFEGSCK